MKDRRVKNGMALAAILAALAIAGCASAGRPSSVTVTGSGSARARPDTVNMTISLGHVAATTREAQAEVASMVARALGILRDMGVEERNIATAALRFSPEYEWLSQGRVLIGQRAEQSISFSIEGIDGENEGAPSRAIDLLIGINGIELQGMRFVARDSAGLQRAARETAFRNALEKAEQFAGLSGLSVARALSIVEQGAQAQPALARQALAMDMAMAEAGAATELPAGEIEITATVVIEFLLR